MQGWDPPGPRPPSPFRMAFPGAVVSTRFCLVARGWPCNTPRLMSICSRNWNHCECTRTLQHVAMSRDTVENPSLQIGPFMCWRLRRRQSIRSRRSAAPAPQRACPGPPGAGEANRERTAAAEGLSAGSAVLMSLRILFILHRALFDV